MASLVLFTLLSALARTAVALPNTSNQPQCVVTNQLATFEGIPASALNGVETPVPTGYKGLYWQAFDATMFLNPGNLPGVLPHSGTNTAVVDVESLTRGNAMLTTNFTASNTTSFTLSNFYFGCVLSLQNGATAAPQQCLINIAGYRGKDNSVSNAQQVCAMQFQYNPSTATGAQQLANTGSIYGCVDLQFLIVTFNLPGGEAAANPDLLLVTDDFAYQTKACPSSS